MADNNNENQENCTHDCSSCSSSCSKKQTKISLGKGSSVRKVIAVVSGKGGVGKSLVTTLLATEMNKKGYKTAILDGDITGSSIPTGFGMGSADIFVKDEMLEPAVTKSGIQFIGTNLLLQNETDPLAWRGAKIAGQLLQFWKDVRWHDVDYMFIDTPPGTGDVSLTLFQSVPVDGIIIVSTPQSLVKMIVEKAIKLANLMNVPIIGLVESMSYVKCPDCGKEMRIFGKSHVDEISQAYGLPVLARIPIDENISKAVDEGKIEDVNADFMQGAVDLISTMIKAKK